MPNWVYNNVVITAPTYVPEDVSSLNAQAVKQLEECCARLDKGCNGDGPFAEIVPPPDRDEYYARGPIYPEEYNPDDKTMPKEFLPQEIQDRIAEAETNHRMYGWYGWNVNNWGTKWDASDPTVEYNEGDYLGEHGTTSSIDFAFRTAWSPPTAFLVELSRQYPLLHIENEWQEEQGFGAVEIFNNGEGTLDREWDIPNSHAEWEALDQEDRCICTWGDQEDYFDDCPKRCQKCNYDISEYTNGATLCAVCEQEETAAAIKSEENTNGS